MSDVKYHSVIPLNPNESDRMTKLVIKGDLLPDAESFSINFVNSPCDVDNITYHFKVMVKSQTLIENYKTDGAWSPSHMEQEINVFNEASFSLLFQLDYDSSAILVYHVIEQGVNFITRYETYFSLSDIQSVQVWGDVQKIQHFELNYD